MSVLRRTTETATAKGCCGTATPASSTRHSKDFTKTRGLSGRLSDGRVHHYNDWVERRYPLGFRMNRSIGLKMFSNWRWWFAFWREPFPAGFLYSLLPLEKEKEEEVNWYLNPHDRPKHDSCTKFRLWNWEKFNETCHMLWVTTSAKVKTPHYFIGLIVVLVWQSLSSASGDLASGVG